MGSLPTVITARFDRLIYHDVRQLARSGIALESCILDRQMLYNRDVSHACCYTIYYRQHS
jgi:hypothetical protein